MTHRIVKVEVSEKYILVAIFQNGVEKKYDVRQLFSLIPQFQALDTSPGLFEKVRVDIGGYGIAWNDKLDLSAEEIWEHGINTGVVYELNIQKSLGEKLSHARKLVGMRQVELSEVTGISQGDISRIERGIANPSLLTLERLADGLGLKLNIEFVK